MIHCPRGRSGVAGAAPFRTATDYVGHRVVTYFRNSVRPGTESAGLELILGIGALSIGSGRHFNSWSRIRALSFSFSGPGGRVGFYGTGTRRISVQVTALLPVAPSVRGPRAPRGLKAGSTGPVKLTKRVRFGPHWPEVGPGGTRKDGSGQERTGTIPDRHFKYAKADGGTFGSPHLPFFAWELRPGGGEKLPGG